MNLLLSKSLLGADAPPQRASPAIKRVGLVISSLDFKGPVAHVRAMPERLGPSSPKAASLGHCQDMTAFYVAARLAGHAALHQRDGQPARRIRGQSGDEDFFKGIATFAGVAVE